MSTPAGGGLIGGATIRITADTTAAALAIRGLTRDANGHLRDLRGRFVSESRLINNSLTTVTGGSNRFREALGSLKGAALSLAPALIPMAAAAAPIAASVGAAAIAVGAFGAAAAGQVVAINEASEAEKKYTDAVDEHGRASKEATDAERAYLTAVQKLPPATRQAAAGLSVLKDEYKGWSDSLAGDTMPVVTKSFAVFGGLFPKLTPVVRGASAELNRLMTIVAGGIQSESFDRFMASFAEFSTGALKRANDGLVRLMRTMDTGKIGGGLSDFMQYAKENGPLVGETLKNVAQALTKLLIAGSKVGVGLLTVVNAFASLVASVPSGLLTNLLQVAIAFKAVKLAAAGFSVVSAGILAATTQITAMRTAAGAATGRMAALGAAMGAMSRTAKIAVAGTGIGLLLVLMSELSQMGESTPPNVDRLTTALGRLGSTGKVTGEAAKAFGADLGKLKDQINAVTSPSIAESVNNWGADVTNGFLAAGDATEDVTKSFDAIDDSLTNLVRGGKAELAGAALANLTRGMNPEQAKKLTESLDGYDAALADAAFEQKLTADGMGLFGAQAQATSAKLAAQKQSADGLRQSIQALNDVNRAALGGMIAFEASIDAAAAAAAAAAQAHTGALRMVNGELDLSGEKAREYAAKLNVLAAETDATAASARDQGKSWETVNGIYQRGRGELIKSADLMGLTREEAKKLADQILKTPNKTAYLKGNIQDLQAKLADAKKRLQNAPKGATASIKGNIADLNRKIAVAYDALNNLDGYSATTWIYTNYDTPHHMAHGGPVDTPHHMARGGPVGYPHGGRVKGPGTSTSDSVLAMLSNGEYVIRAAAVRRYGADMFAALNALQAPSPRRTQSGVPASAPLEIGSTRTAPIVNMTYAPQINLTNQGAIGSQRELQNWFTGMMDSLRLQGRLPTGAAA